MKAVFFESYEHIPGKLATAELWFGPEDGPLDGLKLVGFGVWQRRGGPGRVVTFPNRAYTVAGAHRNFDLLRPSSADATRDNFQNWILDQYDTRVTA